MSTDDLSSMQPVVDLDADDGPAIDWEALRKKPIKLILPDFSPEALERGRQNFIKHLERQKLSCMSTYLPVLERLGIDIPRTEMIDLCELLGVSLYDTACAETEFIDAATPHIQDMCDKIGYPCFFRSGLTSDKHSWKDTCYLSDRESVKSHVNMIMGLLQCQAEAPCDVWVARELLPTTPAFYAFSGEMPIVKEFRFFVKEGVVIHTQPYWPPFAIEKHKTSIENWREVLAEMSVLSDADRDILVPLTETIGKEIGGFWSVDWLWVDAHQKWYCTDMAQGVQSFFWDPNASMKNECATINLGEGNANAE